MEEFNIFLKKIPKGELTFVGISVHWISIEYRGGPKKRQLGTIDVATADFGLVFHIPALAAIPLSKWQPLLNCLKDRRITKRMYCYDDILQLLDEFLDCQQKTV